MLSFENLAQVNSGWMNDTWRPITMKFDQDKKSGVCENMFQEFIVRKLNVQLHKLVSRQVMQADLYSFKGPIFCPSSDFFSTPELQWSLLSRLII